MMLFRHHVISFCVSFCQQKAMTYCLGKTILLLGLKAKGSRVAEIASDEVTKSHRQARWPPRPHAP